MKLNGSKSGTADRRKFPRVPFSSKVRYKEFHNPLKLYRIVSCINLGLGGCQFETFEKLPKDLILTLHINIPIPYTYQFASAKIFAKVVRVRDSENKHFQTSVYFIAIDRKGAVALKQWVDQELNRSQHKHRFERRKRKDKAVAIA